jgi:hypothetical protein
MITHDIQRFSTHLAAIYSNLAKPVLDVILYNYQLSQNVGAEGLVGLTIAVQSTAVLRESPSHCFLRNFFLKFLPSCSQIPHPSFWSLHCLICTTGWITAAYAF